MKKLALPLIAVALIAGCAAQAPVKQEIPQPAVERELSDAAKSVSQSLKRLAEVEQAAAPKTALSSIKPVGPSGDLDKPITVSWVGPVQQLLEKVAASTGYKYSVIGRAPAVPVIVSIEAKDVRAVDIIRDAGLQSGLRAKISVNQKIKTIELAFGS